MSLRSTWQASDARSLAFRSLVKTRVELEKRVGPALGPKRALGRIGASHLSWLAAVYGSDKGATAHRYTDLYEQHFAPLRRSARKVLEIGIYKGASLLMWRDYFPKAEIYGLDLEAVHVDSPRIHTLQGDQSDHTLLAQIRALGPFDVIIDDGSHIAEHILTTFRELYPSVRPGGYYVIEDMQTAYYPNFYQGGPPGHPDTAITLVQGLVDSVNRHHVAEKFPQEAAALLPASSLHVYPRIAFVQRDEGTL